MRETAFVILVLIYCSILRHVTNESTLAKGADPGVLPDKSLQNKEKDLLSQYQPMLQKLLHEKANLQLVAIYAMQVHCHNNSFPKGTLLSLVQTRCERQRFSEHLKMGSMMSCVLFTRSVKKIKRNAKTNVDVTLLLIFEPMGDNGFHEKMSNVLKISMLFF